MKGIRLGVAVFSGPVGWAKAGADIVKDTAGQASGGGDGENKDRGVTVVDGTNHPSGRGQNQESRRAAAQKPAPKPKPKAGNK